MQKQKRFRVFLIAALFALPAQAQPWGLPSASQPDADEGRSFTEAGVEVASLLGGLALSLELRIGKQLPGGFSWSNGVHLLATPVQSGTGDGFRRINALAYVGPGISYAGRLAGPVGGYAGTVFGIGVAGFEKQRGGRRIRSSDVFAGVKPSAGLFLQAERLPYVEALQVRAGASLFAGYVFNQAFNQARAWRHVRGDRGAGLVGWPSVAVSLRVIR